VLQYLQDPSNNDPKIFQSSVILKTHFLHRAGFQLKKVVRSLGFHIEQLATLHLNVLMKTITASGDKTRQGAM